MKRNAKREPVRAPVPRHAPCADALSAPVTLPDTDEAAGRRALAGATP